MLKLNTFTAADAYFWYQYWHSVQVSVSACSNDISWTLALTGCMYYGYEGVKVTLAAALLPDAAEEDASSQHPRPSCSRGGQPPVTPRWLHRHLTYHSLLCSDPLPCPLSSIWAAACCWMEAASQNNAEVWDVHGWPLGSIARLPSPGGRGWRTGGGGTRPEDAAQLATSSVWLGPGRRPHTYSRVTAI